MFENIKVIKRDGKKVDFDGSKIALCNKKKGLIVLIKKKKFPNIQNKT